LGSDYIRSSGNSPSRNNVLDSDFNTAPEKRRSNNHGYSLGSKRQSPTNLKRLIPMAKPRASAQSMLNDIKYDDKIKMKRAKLLWKKRLARAALGLKRGALPGGGRNPLESLLMRQVMQTSGRGGRKKISKRFG